MAADLSNLAHRDPAATLRDIREPSAAINPDYVAYNVELRDGESWTGFVRAQSAEELRIVGIDGKERTARRGEIASLTPSAVSLMPSGLLDGVGEKDVRSLLTFLGSAPPTRLEGATVLKEALKFPEGNPVSVVLVASKQDHGPGQHDYPAWQTNWMRKFGARAGLKLSAAWEWPSAEQWKGADAVVFYCWNHDWSEGRYGEMDAFQKRGGGLAVFHAGCIADTKPEKLAERIGLAAQPGPTKYLHAPFTLKFGAPEHPIGFKKMEVEFLDEPYWPMIGETNRIRTLATAKMDGAERPMLWTYERGEGRVFVSIPGHYTWTWEDPLFEEMAWRAILWTAGR